MRPRTVQRLDRFSEGASSEEFEQLLPPSDSVGVSPIAGWQRHSWLSPIIPEEDSSEFFNRKERVGRQSPNLTPPVQHPDTRFHHGIGPGRACLESAEDSCSSSGASQSHRDSGSSWCSSNSEYDSNNSSDNDEIEHSSRTRIAKSDGYSLRPKVLPRSRISNPQCQSNCDKGDHPDNHVNSMFIIESQEWGYDSTVQNDSDMDFQKRVVYESREWDISSTEERQPRDDKCVVVVSNSFEMVDSIESNDPDTGNLSYIPARERWREARMKKLQVKSPCDEEPEDAYSYQSAKNPLEDDAENAEPTTLLDRLSNDMWVTSLIATQALDLLLKTCTIVIFWVHEGPSRLCLIVFLPFYAVVGLICVNISMNDAEVIEWINSSSVKVVQILKGFMVVVVGGLMQFIQVKRIADQFNQLHMPEIIQALEEGHTYADEKVVGQEYHNTKMDTNAIFFGGIPYLTCLCFVLFSPMSQDVPGMIGSDTTERTILVTAFLVSFFTIDLAIVHMDYHMSSTVKVRWHHFDPVLQHCRAYPFVHVLFRTLEIFHCTLCMTMIFRLGPFEPIYRWGAVALIYACNLRMLEKFTTPSSFVERCKYMVIAVAMMVANLSYFIDEKGYALPARRLSRWLKILRVLQFIGVVGLIVGSKHLADPTSGSDSCTFEDMGAASTIFVLTTFGYFLLLFTWMGHQGDDLHTAALSGDVAAVKELLMEDSLSHVNDCAKEEKKRTPLHYAAKRGHLKVAQALVDHNAEIHVKDTNGDTPLHLACKYGHTILAEYLVEQCGGNPFIRNYQDMIPGDCTKNSAFRERMSSLAQTHSEQQSNVRRQSVVITNCDTMDLTRLYPWVQGHEIHSGSQSVSSLIFGQGVGYGKQIMRHEHDTLTENPYGQPSGLRNLTRVGNLGRGGFGKVIEVCDQSTWKRFAMKLQKKEYAMKVAVSEAKVLQKMRHPYIVRLYQAFQTPTFLVLLMEFCPLDLNRRILQEEDERFHRCPGLPVRVAARYAGQVNLALAHLHKERFVFRDLKPENVLIDDKDRVKLADFGLTRQLEDGGTSMAGTRGYMPPEMLEDRPVDCSADLYAFGVMLSMMLLGERVSEKRDVLNRVVLLPPAGPSDIIPAMRIATENEVPESALNLVQRLLSVDCEKRGNAQKLMQDAFFLETLRPGWERAMLANQRI